MDDQGAALAVTVTSRTCCCRRDGRTPQTFGTVYAGWHGIEGVLKEELLNLSKQPEEEIALLASTPAAGSIGTCRYKLKSSQKEDFELLAREVVRLGRELVDSLFSV